MMHRRGAKAVKQALVRAGGGAGAEVKAAEAGRPPQPRRCQARHASGCPAALPHACGPVNPDELQIMVKYSHT